MKYLWVCVGLVSGILQAQEQPGTSCSVSIVKHPTTVHVCSRGSSTFSITAEGDVSSYQWLADDQELTGETGASLTIDNPQNFDRATIRCRVMTDCGANRLSNEAFLFVVPSFYTPGQLSQWRQAQPDACSDANQDSRVDILDFAQLVSQEDTSQTCLVEITDTVSPVASHQIYSALTSDAGESFSAENTMLLDKASVPDGVLGPDGEIWVYYINGNTGFHAIWVGRYSSTEIEPIRCITLDGEPLKSAVDPDVVRLEDGSYRIFTFTNFGPPDPNQPINRIQTGWSLDGIHFKLDGTVAEVEGITDPSAIQMSNGHWLAAIPMPPVMLIYNSSDGVNWQLLTTIEETGLPELVELPDQRVRMYIGRTQLMPWVSSDQGVTWTRESNIAIEGQEHTTSAEHPSFFKIDADNWRLFYIVPTD